MLFSFFVFHNIVHIVFTKHQERRSRTNAKSFIACEKI